MADISALQALLDEDLAPVLKEDPAPSPAAPAVAPVPAGKPAASTPVGDGEAPFSPEVAAILSGINKANLGANSMLYKAGQGITSLGGSMPNPVSDFMRRGANDSIQKYRDVEEGNRLMGGEDHPLLEIGGSLATLPNLALSKIPGGSNALKSGIIAGTAGGILTPGPNEGQDTNASDFLAGRALQAGYGGLGGGALGALAGVAKGIVAPAVQKGVETLRKYGSDLSKYSTGQLLGGFPHSAEDFLRDVDVLGLTGVKAAQDRGAKEFSMTPIRHSLRSIDEVPNTSGTIQNAFQDAQKKIGAVYNDTLDKMTPIKVGYNSLTAFNKAAQDKVAALNGDPALQNRLIELLNNLGSSVENRGFGAYTLNPTALNGHASDLGKESRAYYGRKDPLTLHEGKYAEAVTDIKNQLKKLLYDGDPTGNLQSADRAFAQIQAPQAAASAAKRAGGDYTPEQLINASTRKQSDKSIAAGTNFYQDLGQAGQETLGSQSSDEWKKAASILGTLSAGGGAAWASPATAAIAAGTIIPTLRAGASAPVQGALARYITSQGPVRKGVGRALNAAPAYLGEAGVPTGHSVADQLLGIIQGDRGPSE